ncbi:MalY/PatB family protein [Acidihalobacter prosperus]|uniref:cysteine-S-conjugate beta-lyase n=1 Tax=Acidihalobacter prosperus TaxID=160660 RepID=A0A1A6C6E1_9GAMM|nr:PatB family C-S lyase [Acidihalobacter prosperus]OBS10105.1 Aspartate aminotransferase [Acidihalobacter prosperus]
MRNGFDPTITPERLGTASLKWDGRKARFGADVLPLWVADMDFPAPACVSQAIQARAAHPVYGYPFFNAELKRAVCGWYARWHGWHVDENHVSILRGVVPALYAAVRALTAPDEGVVVMTPVYPHLIGAVEAHGRRLLASPLLETPEGYRIDWPQLESLMPQARMLLLCSPHNPVGRVWTQEELSRLFALARRHGVIVVSDEVHGDLSYHASARHRPFGSLPGAEAGVITLLSAGKSFNIAGLELAVAVTADIALRERFEQALRIGGLAEANLFALVAAEAAWREGDAWLRELVSYLAETADWLGQRLAEVVPSVGYRPPEFGYLAWLDCRRLGLDDAVLQRRMVQVARLGLNPGTDFGPGGEGYMRLNFATSRAVLEEALLRLQRVFGG